MTRACLYMFPALINKVATFRLDVKALILVVSRSLLHNRLRINRSVCREEPAVVDRVEGNAEKQTGSRDSDKIE